MTNLAAASIKANIAGATTTRTLGDRFADVVNVKDFGAVGNGIADDTDEIQAAFNAAFGTWTSPNSRTNPTANRPVYFPPGTYSVASKTTNVIGAVSNGGLIRLTVASTTDFVTGDFVAVNSVGGVSAATGLWQITRISNTTFDLQGSTFSGTYTSGGAMVGAALRVAKMSSGRIYGSGFQSTVITNTTSGGITLGTNGCEYSAFEGFQLAATGTGCCAFDFNWDNGANCALNACRFEDIMFTASGGTGISIGARGYMGSELPFINCYWSGCTTGLVTKNSNTLDISIIGGGVNTCTFAAFHIQQGNMGLIANVGFAGNGFDIICTQNGINTVIGCRTESSNFIQTTSGTFHLVNCMQSHGAAPPDMKAGYFIDGFSGDMVLTACTSYIGKIAGNGALTLIGCQFDTLGPTLGGIAVSGAATHGGLIQLTVSDATWWATGDRVTLTGLVGSGGLTAAANGSWTVTYIDATHLDLQGSAFAGTYTSGGTLVPEAGAFLSQDHGYGSINTAPNLNRTLRQSKTAAYSIPRAYSGAGYDNTGATGTVVLTLPTINSSSIGTTCNFYVAAAQTFRATAQNSMTIRNAGSVSASDGNIAASTIGNYVELEAVSATQWVVKSIIGTWTLT